MFTYSSSSRSQEPKLIGESEISCSTSPSLVTLKGTCTRALWISCSTANVSNWYRNKEKSWNDVYFLIIVLKKRNKQEQIENHGPPSRESTIAIRFQLVRIPVTKFCRRIHSRRKLSEKDFSQFSKLFRRQNYGRRKLSEESFQKGLKFPVTRRDMTPVKICDFFWGS